MEPQQIKGFLKSIKNTDIEELVYKDENIFFRLKKSDVETILPEIKKVETIEKSIEVLPIVPIKSQMVGTFILSQNNSEFFVREGGTVENGQKVGQIEAMKIIKDVFSNVSGKIVKILVSNGEFIEYGQELFLVDTSIKVLPKK